MTLMHQADRVQSSARRCTPWREANRFRRPDEPSVGPPAGALREARLGPYRICAFLRAGGMGEIYRAVDERLERTVALKVLPTHRSSDPHRRRRLWDEARLLSAISHPHICTLYDVGYSAGIDFLVLEFLRGRTLAERLEAGPVLLPEALRIGAQVASALDAAHRAGIVHRDLKPGNIMLTGLVEGSDPRVKLLDFGLARPMGNQEIEPGEDPTECTTKPNLGDVEGTWPYMAPEQFGEGDLDARTDVWALGVVLYEMVCGRRPFQGHSAPVLLTAILRATPQAPSEVSAACSREVSQLIERCLEKDKSKRWSSCAELGQRLGDVAPSRGPDPEKRRARKGSGRFLARIGAAAALLGCLIVAAPVAGDPGPARDRRQNAAPPSVAERPVPQGRLDRQQMEEFLLRGRIGQLQTLSTGVTGSARAVVTWQGASHPAHVQTVDTFLVRGRTVRNQSDCYRYNVAAYRLDKMLSLGMVPVSVERTVGREAAAVTWWVDDVEMMELERRKLDRQPTDIRSWNDQMYRAYVFQELISNSDFNQTNVLITKDWRVWLIDFTRAFRGHRRLADPGRLRRIDGGLLDALARLREENLVSEMKGLLIRSEIRAILARRDLILATLSEAVPPTGTVAALEPTGGRPRSASGGGWR